MLGFFFCILYAELIEASVVYFKLSLFLCVAVLFITNDGWVKLHECGCKIGFSYLPAILILVSTI